ncbi:MAG: FAD-dependent oxidoreductase [Candidatus Thermoplasmatota archaeon]
MNRVNDKADVVIIGGGVNGCSLAYQLSKRGLKVVLCEKSVLCSGATGRCGAGIRQQWSTRENIELSIASVKIFEGLEKELGRSIGFRQGGYLIIIHDEGEMQQAEDNVSLQRSLGLDVFIIPPERITDIFPLADIKGMRSIGATFCPTDGHADPFKTTYAYADAARRNKAKIYQFTEVTGFKTNQGVIEKVITTRGSIKTNLVVNAAGPHSRELASMLGVKLPITPLKKEILVTERIKRIFDAMVISFRDGVYFSQQSEGQILGGVPIPNEKPGYYTEPTFRFLVRMSKTLIRYAPALHQVRVVRQWTGFYDMSPDARPILGEVPGVKGFLQCNGFSGHGFMLSPMVTRILTDYITEGKIPEVLERLSVKRFTESGADLAREASVVG